MEAKRTRPSRWRRNDEQRRASVRRMLAAGAAVGLLCGLLAQFAVDSLHVDGAELRWLVRLALLLPAGIFVAWWLLVPGMSLEAGEPERESRPTVDPGERLQQIESTFDSAAVPSSASVRVSRPTEAVREELRRSISRPSTVPGQAAQFGLRRTGVPTDADRAAGS